MMSGLEITAGNKEVKVSRAGGAPVLTHRLPAAARPTFHPIVAPDGKGVMTEDKPPHHVWQQGLYTGFNLVNGIGFWRNEAKDGSFAPRLEGKPAIVDGVAKWQISNPWRHPDGSPMVHETQAWSLRADEASYTLELDWGLRAEIDIEIGQFMAGGLFLRMPYTPEKGARALNSAGQTNADAEKQRANWLAVAMPLEGRGDWAGMAIMDHPSNPAHPTTWRMDNEYGISPSRVIAGSWKIPKGTTDRYRYRIHVFCGDIDANKLDGEWQEFARN